MSQFGAQGFAAHGYSHNEILGHYYPGTQIARVPRDVRIRVLLSARRSAVTIGSTGSIALRDGGGHSTVLPQGIYRVDPTMTLRVGSRSAMPIPPLRFDPTVETLAVDGHAFRGSIVISRDEGGLSVVNDVPIDLYVRGVVPWEMPARWHFEALEAQAIAARSYALADIRRDRSFDVYPDQRSQMYGGVRAEQLATNRAVAATSGEVLAWEGRVASTYFSSSSGGRTAAVGDAWPGAQAIPYLKSVTDPYDKISPEHHWGPYFLTGATLSAKLGIPAIEDVRPILNGSNRVAALRITAAGKAHILSGTEVARALGLRSSWFSIRRAGVRGVFRSCKTRPHAFSPPPVSRSRPMESPPVRAPEAALNAEPDGASREALLVAAALAVLGSTVVLRHRSGGFEPWRRVALLAGLSSTAAAGAIGISALHQEQRAARRVTFAPALVGTQHPGAHLQPGVSHASPARVPAPKLPSLPVPQRVRGVLQWHSYDTADRPAVAPSNGHENFPSAAPLWQRDSSAGPETPPPAQLDISDVHLVAVSPSEARVAWRTSGPAETRGARGFSFTPTLWTEAGPSSLEHETVFSGLDAASSYRIWLQAVDAWGQTTTATLTLSTPPLAESIQARADGDRILLNDQPFFPRILWATCAHELEAKIDEGINLFMGNGCGTDAALLEALGGRAVAVVASATGETTGQGLVGWYYPDEWDEHLPGTMSANDLHRLVSDPPPGLLSFLTLTNHFYSGAAPLPQGRGIYGSLVQVPDVIGFDIYPLQIWCRADRFADIFDAQRELDQLTNTKPSFQWIEVRAMQCADADLRPEADSVRAETWLAIAGGADGIGYFPNDWTPEVGAEITRTNSQIKELAPGLLGDRADATSDSPSVRIGARTLNGALYVIAVNTSRVPVDAAIRLPGLAARPVDVLGEDRNITPAGDAFGDHFAGLGVHIYVVAPGSWDPGGVTGLLYGAPASDTDSSVDVREVPAGSTLMR